MIKSFDIYDTVITRIFARPSDLFYGLAAELESAQILSKDQLSQFPTQRIQAETIAREKTPFEEVTLSEIYDELASLMKLTEQERELTMQLEIEMEKRSIRPIQKNALAIQSARDAGNRILFISDMYLDSSLMRDMLANNGLIDAHDGLYMSSDNRVSKWSGNLFKCVLEKEQINPGELHHTGDNYEADIKRAAELGIKTTYFPDAHLNRYEDVILTTPGDYPIHIQSTIAGASRLARLACPYDDQYRQTIWKVGASLAGPILFGYVAWLIADAVKNRVQRLYFFSRDGQIMQRLALIICERLRLDLECRYLYGSRQAWHLPAIEELGEPEYTWILAQTEFLSVRSCLRRIHIEPEEVEATLQAFSLEKQSWDLNLDKTGRANLDALIRSGRLDGEILHRAAEQRKLVYRYLLQEDFQDEVRIAVVDLGWHGRLQRSLGNILALSGKQIDLRGYYFGLVARVWPHPGDELRAYFWDYARDSKTRVFNWGIRPLMEIFAAADHGSVVGYDYMNGKLVPRLLKQSHLISWGVDVQQSAMLAFAKALDGDSTSALCDPNWALVFEKMIDHFYLSPDHEEAQAYGRYPLAEDQNETTFVPYATPLSLKDIPTIFSSGEARHHHNEWRQASDRLTPRMLYYSVRFLERLAGSVITKKDKSEEYFSTK